MPGLADPGAAGHVWGVQVPGEGGQVPGEGSQVPRQQLKLKVEAEDLGHFSKVSFNCHKYNTLCMCSDDDM